MLKPQRTSTEYPRILEKVLPKLTTIGFGDFKADLPEFSRPKRFLMFGSKDNFYMPDISATRRGKKAFIEISTRKADEQRLISKWKLLSKLASSTGGFFGIVTPSGTIKFTKDLLEAHQIEAKLIRI